MSLITKELFQDIEHSVSGFVLLWLGQMVALFTFRVLLHDQLCLTQMSYPSQCRDQLFKHRKKSMWRFVDEFTKRWGISHFGWAALMASSPQNVNHAVWPQGGDASPRFPGVAVLTPFAHGRRQDRMPLGLKGFPPS